jgi:hypothetical protein
MGSAAPNSSFAPGGYLVLLSSIRASPGSSVTRLRSTPSGCELVIHDPSRQFLHLLIKAGP